MSAARNVASKRRFASCFGYWPSFLLTGMTDLSEYKHCPTIHVFGLPKAERKSAAHIQMLLRQLGQYNREFAASVELFNHSIGQMAAATVSAIPRAPTWDWLDDWMHIAARDGAMTIFHFGRTVELTRAYLPKCPTVLSLIDQVALRESGKLLRVHFPHFEAVRHSVGHAAELMGTEKNRDSNSVSGPYDVLPNLRLGDHRTKVLLRNTLKGNRLLNTFKGKTCEYEISARTIKKLSDVRLAFYSAFLDVEKETLSRSPKS
ncbi:MAG: hypothetical protein ACREDN_02425 [Aestuariivirga sp.]